MAQIASKSSYADQPSLLEASEEAMTHPRRKAVSLLICALLIIAACVPPFFVSGAIGYMGVLFVVFFLACTAMALQVSSRGVDFGEIKIGLVFRRLESAQMIIPVRNRSWFPISRMDVYLLVPDEKGGMRSVRSTVVPLCPLVAEDITTVVCFPHIGMYPVGVERVTVFDPTGLFWRTIDIDFSMQVEVLPRIVPAGEVNFSQKIYRESLGVSSAITPDSMDYAGSREFVPGDPMKLVHWKLTARSNAEYTKVLETHGRPSLSLIMDLSLPDLKAAERLDVFDALVEVTCFLAYAAKEQGMEVSLFQHDADMNSVVVDFQSERSLMPLLPRPQDVGRIECVEEMLNLACSNLYASGNVILCAAHMGLETADRLSSLRHQGRNPLLVFITPQNRATESMSDVSKTLDWLKASGIEYYVCSSVEGLGDLL